MEVEEDEPDGDDVDENDEDLEDLELVNGLKVNFHFHCVCHDDVQSWFVI